MSPLPTSLVPVLLILLLLTTAAISSVGDVESSSSSCLVRIASADADHDGVLVWDEFAAFVDAVSGGAFCLLDESTAPVSIRDVYRRKGGLLSSGIGLDVSGVQDDKAEEKKRESLPSPSPVLDGLCEEVYLVLYRLFDIDDDDVTFCEDAIVRADADSDSELSPDTEFLRLVDAVSGGTIASADGTFNGLSENVRDLFRNFAVGGGTLRLLGDNHDSRRRDFCLRLSLEVAMIARSGAAMGSKDAAVVTAASDDPDSRIKRPIPLPLQNTVTAAERYPVDGRWSHFMNAKGWTAAAAGATRFNRRPSPSLEWAGIAEEERRLQGSKKGSESKKGSQSKKSDPEPTVPPSVHESSSSPSLTPTSSSASSESPTLVDAPSYVPTSSAGVGISQVKPSSSAVPSVDTKPTQSPTIYPVFGIPPNLFTRASTTFPGEPPVLTVQPDSSTPTATAATAQPTDTDEKIQTEPSSPLASEPPSLLPVSLEPGSTTEPATTASPSMIPSSVATSINGTMVPSSMTTSSRNDSMIPTFFETGTHAPTGNTTLTSPPTNTTNATNATTVAPTAAASTRLPNDTVTVPPMITAVPNNTTTPKTSAPTNGTTPSDAPTLAPSGSRSDAPSVAPSYVPTVGGGATTESPTRRPTTPPEIPPSASSPPMPPRPTQEPGTEMLHQFIGVRLTFEGVGSLDDDQIDNWQLTTESWFDGFYGSIRGRRRRRRRRRRLRRLQQGRTVYDMQTIIQVTKQQVTTASDGTTSNTLTYNQQIQYVATTGAPPPAELIVAPFRDEFANRVYSNRLTNTDPEGFGSVVTPIQEPAVPVTGDGNRNRDLSIWVIIVIVVAAGIAVAMLGFVGYRYYTVREVAMSTASSRASVASSTNASVNRRRISRRDDSTIGTYDYAYTGGGSYGYGGGDVQTLSASTQTPPGRGGTIASRTQVSSLTGGNRSPSYIHRTDQTVGSHDRTVESGDPSSTTTGTLTSGCDKTAGSSKSGIRTADSTSSSVYYSSAIAAGSPVSASNNTAASNPRVKKEKIDIYAPPGRLGVVIDTPDEGPPVVHSVKENSIIAGEVQVGDKVVAVDDQDVRYLNAIHVSRMIGKKASNPRRKITIVRTTFEDEPVEER